MQAGTGAVLADQVTAHTELSSCHLTRCLFCRQQQLVLKTLCFQLQLNHQSPMLSYIQTQKRHKERYSTTVTQSPERPGLSQLASATQHHTRETRHGIEKHRTRRSLTAAGYQKRMPLNSETFRYETASDLICYQHLEEQEDKTSGKHQRCSGKSSSALQFNVQTKQKQH